MNAGELGTSNLLAAYPTTFAMAGATVTTSLPIVATSPSSA